MPKRPFLLISRNSRFGAKSAEKSLEHKSSPLRLNKATKIRSASNHFKILHLNTRSIKKHHEELQALISFFESPPSVICLTESWLTVNDDPNLFKVTNYNNCLSKSRSGRGGGIMIQINDEVTLIEELNCKLNETRLVHLKFGELRIAQLVVYNPPRNNKQNFIFELDKTLEHINESYDRIIVCGDFSNNVLDKNLMTSSYLSTIQSNGFQLCCREPTHISRNTSTCLDHFFVKNLRIQKTFVMEDHNYCEHFPIVLEIEKISRSCSSEIGFRDTSFLNSLSRMYFFLDNLSKSLATIRYQETETINCAFDRFKITFKEV